MSHAILTHGGAGSSSKDSDGPEAAARAAAAVLEAGGDAMAAALAATVTLEDDPRFNAGTGSNLRLDGRVIEMDASIMTSDGRFGAVAGVQRVKNPILVAAKVRDTPHLMLAGDGATAFARRLGLPEYDPTTDGARKKYDRALAELRGQGDGAYAEDAAPWRAIALDKVWNFPGEPFAPRGAAADPKPRVRPLGDEGCDTVGAVIRDSAGRFAATASTGGTLYMLRGRVGDSPLMGCGVYAGPHGAVAATGIGEEIVRRFLSKTVYDWLANGMTAEAAALRGVAMFPNEIDVGLLVVGELGCSIAANRDMASAKLTG
ncbi:MAG: isoaspartyl peptidase/L-asparaginase [Polyangiaceae bacterium]